MTGDKKLLYADDYVSVTYSSKEGVHRLVRSSTPYPELSAVRSSFGALLKSLPTGLAGQKTSLLIVDMRAAPARNDLQFEETQKEYRQHILAIFARVATLVSTRAGLLNVQRYGREDGSRNIRGFQRESDAMHYLLTGELPKSTG